MSGTALALLIVLLDMQGGRARRTWIAPGKSRQRYDLSADTWTKGVRELTMLGLLSLSKMPQGDIFDYRRLRNAYWLNEAALEGSPQIVVTP
jgi:hypothetical protein